MFRRPLRRRLLAIAAVISLLLCVATIALWIASFFRGYVHGANFFEPSGTGRRWTQSWWIASHGSVRFERLVYEVDAGFEKRNPQVPSTQNWTRGEAFSGLNPRTTLGFGFVGRPPRG